MDYISTKKKKVKYQFVTRGDSKTLESPNPTEKLTYFYNICAFPDDHSGRYHMRQFLYDGDQFISTKDYHLSKSSYKKFFKSKRPNEYKVYNLRCLDDNTCTRGPTLHDMNLANSELLNNDYGYSGYAPF